jgi:hypothetical protein
VDPGGQLDPRLTAAWDDEREPPSRPLLRRQSKLLRHALRGRARFSVIQSPAEPLTEFRFRAWLRHSRRDLPLARGQSVAFAW